MSFTFISESCKWIFVQCGEGVYRGNGGMENSWSNHLINSPVRRLQGHLKVITNFVIWINSMRPSKLYQYWHISLVSAPLMTAKNLHPGELTENTPTGVRLVPPCGELDKRLYLIMHFCAIAIKIWGFVQAILELWGFVPRCTYPSFPPKLSAPPCGENYFWCYHDYRWY